MTATRSSHITPPLLGDWRDDFLLFFPSFFSKGFGRLDRIMEWFKYSRPKPSGTVSLEETRVLSTRQYRKARLRMQNRIDIFAWACIILYPIPIEFLARDLSLSTLILAGMDFVVRRCHLSTTDNRYMSVTPITTETKNGMMHEER